MVHRRDMDSHRTDVPKGRFCLHGGCSAGADYGAVRYAPFSGFDIRSTAFYTYTYMPIRGRVRRVIMYVIANSLDADAPVRLMKNGSETGVSFTVPAGEARYTEEWEGSVQFNKGDYFYWEIDASTATTGTLLVRFSAEVEVL